MRLNLPLYSYELRSKPASPARLVNCFPEQLPPGAATQVSLNRSPGINGDVFDTGSDFTVGAGPIHGMYAKAVEFASGRQNYLYVASGSRWYAVDSVGTTTFIGDISTANRIDMSSNTTDVVLVNEPRAYYWDGATFGEITDDDFLTRGAGDVEYLDHYMLFREPNSNRIFLSDIDSVTDYDALQFVEADDAPDELIGLLADRGMALAFGTDTIEMLENTGAAGVPFERVINGTIEVGCLSSVSIARVFNQVFWVADDYTVRRLDGLVPSRVSTHAIEQHLISETLLEAFGYAQEGHFFYVLTTDAGTYQYDVVTQEWSERESYGHANWLPRHHAQFNGLQLVGDSNSNKIGYLDFDTYTEWGDTQRMEWTYQTIYADGQRAFHDRFEIVLESGVGATTGQGVEPKIMLQYSDDGGLTWESLPDKAFGKLGDYEDRAVWHNLGSARKRVYRAAVSDPVPVTVTDTIVEVRGGRL
jgi:hypothetical protein